MSSVSRNLGKVRYIVKKLRTTEYHRKLKMCRIKIPPIDCITRWGSTYLMVQIIFSQKEELETLLLNDQLKVDENLWSFMAGFVIAFKPMYDATIKLQAESLTLGDFYRLWKECEIELEDIGCDLCQKLKDRMMEREKKLHNDAFICNLYMDPRFNFLGSLYLSDENKIKARVSILNYNLNRKSIVKSKGCTSTYQFCFIRKSYKFK